MLGGTWIALTPVLLFGLVPILDVVFGLDKRDPSPDAARPFSADVALFAWLPIQLAVIGMFVAGLEPESASGRPATL